MRVYNPMTVIRQTSRKILQAFFAELGCLDFIDFENDRLYEIQDAFRTLPEKDDGTGGRCDAKRLQLRRKRVYSTPNFG